MTIPIGKVSPALAVFLLMAAVIPMDAVAIGIDSQTRILEVPQGVRNLAMGWSGVADGNDPANIYYNPANVARSHGITAQYNGMNWPDDADFLGLGLRSRIGRGETAPQHPRDRTEPDISPVTVRHHQIDIGVRQVIGLHGEPVRIAGGHDREACPGRSGIERESALRDHPRHQVRGVLEGQGLLAAPHYR